MREEKSFWLDNIPWPMLIVGAILLGLAPFAHEPHLLEKFKMLLAGQLSRPIDIFDLFMHGTPLILMAWKLMRQMNSRS